MGDMVIIDEQVFADIADAIRDKNGTEETYKPREMAAAIGDIETGGGGITWDGLIENDYENEDVTYNGTTFSATIAIAKCRINKLILPRYKSGGTSWGEGGQWKEVDAPELTSLGLYGLRSCTKMIKAHLPKVTSLGNNNGFNGCTQLAGIVLPSLNSKIGSMSFRTNSKLKYGDFKNVTSIETYAFQDCVIFDTLIIRNTSTAATLANINAFNNTPFASGKAGGTLYVPSALISDYQSATNWSVILGYTNNSITSIEGSIYETQYADGTLISS